MRELVIRAYPTISPRHLEIPSHCQNDLIMVNDTASDENFMIVKISTDPSNKRRDGFYQQHKVHEVSYLCSYEDLFK